MGQMILMISLMLFSSSEKLESRQNSGPETMILIEHQKTGADQNGYTKEKWVWTYIDPISKQRHYFSKTIYKLKDQ